MKKYLNADFIGTATLCLAIIFASIWLFCESYDVEQFDNIPEYLPIIMRVLGILTPITIIVNWVRAVVDENKEA